MHTITLKVQDSIYDHIIFLLSNLNTKKLEIVEDKITPMPSEESLNSSSNDIQAFSNHSANLIDDWKDMTEDEIWK